MRIVTLCGTLFERNARLEKAGDKGTDRRFRDGRVVFAGSFPKVMIWTSSLGILPTKKIGQRLARFRQITCIQPIMMHWNSPDGLVALLTGLGAGQPATVLQLPATALPVLLKRR